MIAPTAAHSELIAHFRVMGARFAAMPHDDAIHACLSCAKLDENTCSKKYDRYRTCSPECEAVLNAYEKTLAA